MPKRKREQNCSKQNGGERKFIAKDPNYNIPLRKSARLQERRDQEVRPGKEKQQLHQLPSPYSSYSQDQLLYQKRNQSNTYPQKDDSPPTQRPRPPENALEARSTLVNHYDPIGHWRETGYWPPNFVEKGVKMGNSNNTSGSSNKRPRASSYTRSVKDGDVPEQYTSAYETWIGTKGLNMDLLKGEELVSEESKELCLDLQKITHQTIPHTISPEGTARKVINLCQTRNEPTVQRVVTTIIIPPIVPLYVSGNKHLEHIVDEVNTDWYKSCVLAGPLPRPDFAIGLSSSTFTSAEIDKLKNFTTIDNWTQFTEHMYFPFLMCEVKCGKEGINRADRQNMHSCSVAVRALLRIAQEADKYRSENGLALLTSRVLVFSISHDHQDARLYGHYALIDGEKWSYYRYSIKRFHLLTSENDLLTLYNFVQNLLISYAPKHLKLIKDALAALPDPTTLSFSTSEIGLYDNPQQGSQDQNTATFRTPGRPASALQNEEMVKMAEQMEKQREQITELLQQLQQQQVQMEQDGRKKEEEREREKQESKEKEERMEERTTHLMKLIADSKAAK